MRVGGERGCVGGRRERVCGWRRERVCCVVYIACVGGGSDALALLLYCLV